MKEPVDPAEHNSPIWDLESKKIPEKEEMLSAEKDQLVQALKAALEHENHEDGKCGCGWTLKAREVLEAVEGGKA